MKIPGWTEVSDADVQKALAEVVDWQEIAMALKTFNKRT